MLSYMQLVRIMSPVGPFRDRHFSLDPASLSEWAKVGYNTNDVKTFLTLMRGTLNSGNLAMDLRITRSFEFRYGQEPEGTCEHCNCEPVLYHERTCLHPSDVHTTAKGWYALRALRYLDA